MDGCMDEAFVVGWGPCLIDSVYINTMRSQLPNTETVKYWKIAVAIFPSFLVSL